MQTHSDLDQQLAQLMQRVESSVQQTLDQSQASQRAAHSAEAVAAHEHSVACQERSLAHHAECVVQRLGQTRASTQDVARSEVMLLA